MRKASINRTTKETDIRLDLNIDGLGKAEIDTGIGFFDHMLTALAVHAGFDLAIKCKGDIEVDTHHTIEDIGIALGQALKEATGDKSGIARYGNFTIPMDEALATCSLDFSGRAYLVYDADFTSDRIGEYDSQMTVEFFKAVAANAAITLHLTVPYGDNDHHKTEALYKAFAHALKEALKIEGDRLLSSKGVL